METNMAAYQVKTIATPTGERLSMLVEAENGLPDYWSTVFSLTQHRVKSMAVNTIQQVLRHIIFLKVFLKEQGISSIDLDDRLQHGLLLHLHEIESLADICKLHLKELTQNTSSKQSRPLSLVSLEKFRSNNHSSSLKTVDADTTGNRIRTIRDFLVWRADVQLARLVDDESTYKKLKESRDFLKEKLTSRIPKPSVNSPIAGRTGLSDEALDELFRTVARDSKTNPWKSEFTKVRNELLVTWLYEYGLRRSEILNIKVKDIDFKSKTFLVLRRADDPFDPRKDQPVVKTHGRKLPMTEKIVKLTLSYIINYRAKLPQSKSHEFLIVADKTGSPMSKIAFNKVFEQLRSANPHLPQDLSPHVLRHSWNDKYSKLMDKQNVSEDREKKTRSYLMGWSENSGSAARYTKRITQQKANEALLEMGNEQTGNALPENEDDLPEWARK